MNNTYSSRHQYNKFLTASLANSEFIARLCVILDVDPYFMPGYLEHIWLAEADNDRRTYQAVLARAETFINTLFADAATRTKVLESWSEVEREALRELLRLRLVTTGSYLKKAKLGMQLRTVDAKFPLQTRLAERTGTYLRCVETLATDELVAIQKEMNGLAPYWWAIARKRSNIPHHQHTRAVTLRYIPTYSVPYQPVDGVHESEPCIYIDRFPLLHERVLRFATDHKLGLGRVAAVAMPPYQQSYRHYDDEEHLRGRNRYHLVVQAGEKNLLSSGTDECYATEGEVWYFDNQAMHRAHNQTSRERIHVIFDGYPLS